jgi:hypothetical protein
MLQAKRFILLGTLIPLLLLTASFTDAVAAAGISPAQEQEFADARAALDSARKAQAETRAPAQIKQAEDLLETAANARKAQDGAAFSRASRLSRAYSELARAMAELSVETQNLSAAREEMQKAKDEIERLRISQ